MKQDQIRDGVGALWGSLTEGWTSLRARQQIAPAQRVSRRPAQISFTNGTVHISNADAPSASGRTEPVRSVSHAPTNMPASPPA